MERKTKTLNCASFSCMKEEPDVSTHMTLHDAVGILNSKRPTRRRISSDVLFGAKKNFYLSFADNVSSREKKKRIKNTAKTNTAISRQNAAQVAASVNRFQHRVAMDIDATLTSMKPTTTSTVGAADTPFPLSPPSSVVGRSHRLQSSFLRGLKRCAEVRRLAWEKPQSAVVGDAISTVARTVFAVRSDFLEMHSHAMAHHLLYNALPLVGAYVSIRRLAPSRRVVLTGIVLHETLNTITLAPCAPNTGFTGTTKTIVKSRFSIEEQIFDHEGAQ